MLACPNINTKEWKDLEDVLGQKEAFREYMKLNDGTIPNLIDIVSLTRVPFSKLEIDENKKLLKEEVANDLIDLLNSKFPDLKGAVINDKEKKWKGKLDGKTPTINLAYAEVSDGFHEFSHPFLMSLRKSNFELFNSLYEDLKNTDEWTEIKDRATNRVNKLYPELKGNANLDLYKEEVLATAIGYASELKLATSKQSISTKLGRIIDSIFKWINSFLKELTEKGFSNRIKTNDLSPNTTFGEIIDMFTDTRSQIILDSNWDKVVNNERIADAMTGVVTTNQELFSNQLQNDLEVEILTNKAFTLDDYLNEWLYKNFKIPRKEFKPRKVKPSELAYNIARSMINNIKQKAFQIQGLDFKKIKAASNEKSMQYKVETVEKLASVLNPIELNYRFSNYLSNKKNVSIALNQPFVVIKETLVKDSEGNESLQYTPNIQISLSEAEAVLQFQSFIKEKFPQRKSISSDELNQEYLSWVTENYGISWIEATAHTGYGMDRISNSGFESYTRTVLIDDFFDTNARHTFKIDKANANGNGLGWYVTAVVNGDRFDHEFQSDILPEIAKDFKLGKYSGSGVSTGKVVKKDRSVEVMSLTQSKLYQMLNASGDVLFNRDRFLMNQIQTIDDETKNAVSRSIQIDSSYFLNDYLNTMQDDIELPFSKLDNYDPAQLERSQKFLLSELDVKINELKGQGYRYNSLLINKLYSKLYNVFLSRKNEQQKELFDWIKTFEAIDINENDIERLELENLPFSKTEETPFQKIQVGLKANKYFYLTQESIDKFPSFLKKMYNVQLEWSQSKAPIKPEKPQDLLYHIKAVAGEAMNLIDNKTGTIKKNYGSNKKSAQRLRDIYKKTTENLFKSYKFSMKQLKAFEWRKTVYQDKNAIVHIAEFYKGQFNRLYRFYDSIYETAAPLAEEILEKEKYTKDPDYDRYKKYNDLYNKWFDIIIPQSINSAKAEGRPYYYLPTAMAMNAVEGNDMAEKVYWTPNDSLGKLKEDNIVTLYALATSYVSQNTPESTAVVRKYLPSDIISQYTEQTTATEIATDLMNKSDFRDSPEFNSFIVTRGTLTNQNGPLYNALIKYARKNNIKITFEKPSWATKDLIKIDLTNYEIKPIDRFSKIDISTLDESLLEIKGSPYNYETAEIETDRYTRASTKLKDLYNKGFKERPDHKSWYVQDHLEVVDNIATELAITSDSSATIDYDVLHLMVWTHDLAKALNNERNSHAQTIAPILKKYGIGDKAINKVISNLRIMDEVKTKDLDPDTIPIEVKILSTADAISHYTNGSRGFLNIYSTITSSAPMSEIKEANKRKLEKDKRKILLDGYKNILDDVSITYDGRTTNVSGKVVNFINSTFKNQVVTPNFFAANPIFAREVNRTLGQALDTLYFLRDYPYVSLNTQLDKIIEDADVKFNTENELSEEYFKFKTLASLLKDKLSDINIKVYFTNDTKITQDNRILGYYNESNKSIIINSTQNKTEQLRTILHEALHAYTLDKLLVSREFYDKIEDYRIKTIDYFKKTDPTLLATYKYELSDADEFISGLFTTPFLKFQLEKIPSGKKTLWDNISNTYKELIGKYHKAEPTLFTDTIEDVFSFEKTYKDNIKNVYGFGYAPGTVENDRAINIYNQYLNNKPEGTRGSVEDLKAFKKFIRNKEFVDPIVDEQKREIGNNIAYNLAAQLSENLGISFRIITPEEAVKITEGTNNPWNGEQAFYHAGTTFFINDGFNSDDVLHEFAHPLIDAVYASNITLFNTLYENLKNSFEGDMLIAEVTALYPEFKTDDPYFQKEVVVRALAKKASDQQKNIQSSNAFVNFIKKILFAIKQALRKVFGTNVKVEKLSSNTTLSDLAKMLRSEKFDIDTEINLSSDYVQYGRGRNPLFNPTPELTKELDAVEDSEISKVIDRFYELVRTQLNQIKSGNYKDAKKILINEETQKGSLQEIKSTLEVTPQISEKVAELLDEVDVREKNAANLVHAIMRFDILTSKMLDHLNQLETSGDTQEVMKSIFQYDLLVRNWSKFMNEMNEQLFDAGLNEDSQLGKILSSVDTKIQRIQKRIQKSYTPGVVDTLKVSLRPLIEGIDDHFQSQIKKIKDKGLDKTEAGAKVIKDLEKEWENTKLTDQKILDLLLGNAGDTNPISAYVEAYTNSPDPIVGGFAMFIKNINNDVDSEALRRGNKFMQEIEPLLKKAGYSRSNFTKLMEKVTFLDTYTYVDPSTGELKTREAWTFLNPFQKVTESLVKFKLDYEKAVESGDKATADQVLKDKKQHLRDFFHQEYVDEFYQREDVYDSLDKNPDLKPKVYEILGFDKNNITPDQERQASEFYDKAGKTAYREKYTILNNIKELDGLNYDEKYYDEVSEQKTILWREYSQLKSLTYPNGEAKFGEDLLAALIERKYRKESEKFFEWKPITGQFDFSLQKFEESLVDAGLTPNDQEYIDKRNKWIKDNTVIKYTKEFYEQRNKVIADIKEILKRVPDSARIKIDSTTEIEEMLDLTTGFRDQNGQIIGGDLSLKAKEKVRDLQKAIIDKKNSYASLNGLTAEEFDELSYLYSIIKSKQKLSPEQRSRLTELVEKKNELGVDKATQAELSALYHELSIIQSREATDYYVNTLNEYLAQMGVPLVDNDSAGAILYPKEYTKLLGKDAKFDKWFLDNHIQKEIYDKDLGQRILVYERLFIWNRVRPNNPDHYQKTTLGNGEVINGVPTLAYFYRTVKDEISELEYLKEKTDLSLDETQKLNELLAKEANGTLVSYVTQKVIGKTIDNRGKFLPKTLAEGAKDARYQNADYENLRKNDPDAFAVLEKMKEYSLENQKDAAFNSRIYLEAPRYRSMAQENLLLKARDAKNKTVNIAKRWWLNFRNLFVKANDDFEEDLNFDPIHLVNADMFNEEYDRIPVTGTYNLKPEEVSMNFLDGLNKYMHSTLKQKAFINANPFAQALKGILSDPKNSISERNNFVKRAFNTLGKLVPVKRKGQPQSTRSKAINNIYNKEFLGENVSDVTKNMPWLWKIKKMLSSISAFGSFAGNIQSSLKNRVAAVLNHLIEVGGGRWIDAISYGKGKIRGFKMMTNLSTELYSTKNKSLDVQLMMLFNVGQEVFKKQFENQFGRSLLTDTLSLSALTSHRKWLQLEAQTEFFAGMLYHIKIPQTINGKTKMIDYINAFEIVNGDIQLKEGIDSEWGPKGAKFKETKNRVHEVMNRLEGTYAAADFAEIDRTFIGSAMKFMKKFFTSMFMNWFAVRRPSAALGTITSGNYVAFLEAIRKMWKYGWSYSAMMDKNEVAAIRKVTTQVVLLSAGYLLLKFGFGWDDGDDLRFDKMRERQIDAIKGGRDWSGWLFNQGLVLTYGTMYEFETFSNPKIFFQTVTGLPVPSALFGMGIEAPYNLIDHTRGWIFDKDPEKSKAYYKQDVGPYWFQKAGQPKAIADLARMFGFTGGFVDPAKGVKGLEDRRKGFFQ